MSAASIRQKALRTLVRVRERQAEALQKTLEQAQEEVAIGQQRVVEAVEHERACVAAEAAGRAELDALTQSPFTPQALRALGFRIDDLKAATAQAGKGVTLGREAVARLGLAVDTAQAAVRRNEQRIESFREEVAKIEREREATQEELAEEETEEASTARFVARKRESALEAPNG